MDLLLTVSKDRPGTLRTQIEEQLRTAIRDGSLRAGTPVPSTRDLAGQIGVSRKVAVDAYAQLAAEGYLAMRQGAQPRVAVGPFRPASAAGTLAAPPPPRFDFLPARPDVSSFPREAWARCLRDAVSEITVADLGYGDAFGVDALRDGLAGYLGRVRGVVADRSRVVVTNGFLPGLGLVCRALAARGARRIACEDPSSAEEDQIAARAGLEAVRVPVDDLGLRVDALERSGADAVVVTPAHQHPTGVVLAPERRAALVAWLRARNAVAIEDDYDAEYRYDRPAIGALQGLDHDHVVYAGTVSKVLAPVAASGLARRAAVPGRRAARRAAALRPGHGADRTTGLRPVPGTRRPGPAPPQDAGPLPRPARRDDRRPRRRASRGLRPRDRGGPARHRRAHPGRRRGGGTPGRGVSRHRPEHDG